MTASEIVFYAVILLANVMQGITGFAGTVLAMPVGIYTVGFEVSRPVLNGLGMFACIMVFAKSYKSVQWKEFAKICIVMAMGIGVGIAIKKFLEGNQKILFWILGAFIVFVAVYGLAKMLFPTLEERSKEAHEKRLQRKNYRAGKAIKEYGILTSAGIIHGMFITGGPLLIMYLTRKLKDKGEFRATISAVWILLNGIIFTSDIAMGVYRSPLVWKPQLISIPFMAIGVFAGGILYRHMSQKVFMMLTYILLIISGVSLFFK